MVRALALPAVEIRRSYVPGMCADCRSRAAGESARERSLRRAWNRDQSMVVGTSAWPPSGAWGYLRLRSRRGDIPWRVLLERAARFARALRLLWSTATAQVPWTRLWVQFVGSQRIFRRTDLRALLRDFATEHGACVQGVEGGTSGEEER